MNLRPRVLVLAIAVPLVFSAAALGDDGIVVHGTGSASTRPTQIEMSATLTGEAELAADARVKFRDAKKRAQAAIASLKEPELSMLPGGLSVGTGVGANAQMMMMRGMAVPNTPQSVRLSEVSRIVLANTDKLEPDEMLDKLLKIIDVAKDAGLQIGPAPARNYYEMQVRAQEGAEGIATVSFKLPDSTALREKAYKVAIEDAKSKAQSLAELSGVKLGRIVSVREDAAGAANVESMVVYNYGARANKESGNDTSITSSTSGDVTLNVGLTVRFEIAK
jgi:uncharacterized protein YggE